MNEIQHAAYQKIEQIALGLPASSQNIKWEHICFVVANKIFMICSIDQTPVSASLKIDKQDFDVYLETDNFVQAPHMAKTQWIMAKDIALVDYDTWEKMIKKSYTLVVGKLPKKLQLQIANAKI